MADKLHFTAGGRPWSLVAFRCPHDFDAMRAAEVVRGQLMALPEADLSALHWRLYIGNVATRDSADALTAAAAGPLPGDAMLILFAERSGVPAGTLALAA